MAIVIHGLTLVIRLPRALILLGLLLSSSAAISAVPDSSCPAVTNNPSVIGLAATLDNGDPLYCEYHYPDTDNNTVVVEYRDFDAQVIARKQLDFATGLLSPSVEQEDLRHGELREVSLIEGQMQVSYRKANMEEVKSTLIDVAATERLVVDAGFDQAVRQSWDTLVAGEKSKIDFLSPVHLRTIKLTIAESQGKRCRKASQQQSDLQNSSVQNSLQNSNSAEQVCFVVRPANTMVSWFVKPLVLIYDSESRQLITYSGSVNITDASGKTLQALIQYQYR